jgi:hypothetical protein
MELRLMESYKRRGGEGEEEEGSASSAMSPHSHPHLADLDEDDSACEEELARLAAQVPPQLTTASRFSLTTGPVLYQRLPPSDRRFMS